MTNSFGSAVRRSVELYKRPAAIALFAALVLSSFALKVRPELVIAAAIALAAALLSLVLDIHKKVSDTPAIVEIGLPRTWPHIEPELRAALAKRGAEVCWLGVTLNDAWPHLVTILEPAVQQQSASAFTVRMVQVEPSYLRAVAGCCSELPQYAEANWARIELFERDYKRGLDSIGARIVKGRYQYMPNFHGVLINNRTLFLSAVSWDGPRMRIAEEPYERFDASTASGEHKIRLFQAWFARAESAATA
ncbi:MAG TPA: hypothetical protein VI485_28025 [Vicinamibacterales bacterium]|nr:hypothetical protein [Vicinamibacterales bacterium]